MKKNGFTPLEIMKLPIITKKYVKDGEPLTGFTIIELVIAIFILCIGIIGVYSAFYIIVILTTNISSSFTAAYLAQEGMEVVRNIRDNNWIIGQDWQTGLSLCETASGCEADYTTGTSSAGAASVMTPWSNNGRYLYIDNINGFYSYNTTGSTQAKFKRKITITVLPPPNDHIMEVSVQVFWQQNPNILNPVGCPDATSNSCSVTTEEYFYNWF